MSTIPIGSTDSARRAQAVIIVDRATGEPAAAGGGAGTSDTTEATQLLVKTAAETTATNSTALAKSEDAAHASGDKGIMALVVRKDTAAALAGADGDYAPLEVDASGRLWTNVGVSVLPTGAATAALQGAQGTGSTYNPPTGGSGEIGYLSGIYAAVASASPTVVAQEAPSWVHIAASSTDTAGGNANDLLDSLLVIPATTSPGAVSFEDGAGTNYTLFAGGASSVSTLIPFPIDMRNIAAGTGWEITTGANVTVIAFYRART